MLENITHDSSKVVHNLFKNKQKMLFKAFYFKLKFDFKF